jgi:Regulator of ribonuclease activity B
VTDIYPNDENGDALRNMAMSGDDLRKARDVDFCIVFRDQDMARRFCDIISKDSAKIDCHKSDVQPGMWDVTVTSYIVPTYDAISALERRLARLAGPLGGQNDGWGSFSVPR